MKGVMFSLPDGFAERTINTRSRCAKSTASEERRLERNPKDPALSGVRVIGESSSGRYEYSFQSSDFTANVCNRP
jgi:hypothetical protein